tara:strand:+ start:1445 stop:1903 length:459 start_codon:yes stop_codon:yes gene_type:complete
MVKQSKNKNVPSVEVCDQDMRNLLELTNAIKDLGNETSEHCDISYKNVQNIVGNLYVLTNIFKFKQPKSDDGETTLWYADYQLPEGVSSTPENNQVVENDGIIMGGAVIQHLRNTINKDISTAKEKHEKSYAENLLKKIRQWRKELNSVTYK